MDKNNISLTDREVYLVLRSNELMDRLSINDWNSFIESYEKDEKIGKAMIAPYNDKYDGWCFITTTLKNILENHSLYDLRFIYQYRTEYHLSFNDNTKLSVEERSEYVKNKYFKCIYPIQIKGIEVGDFYWLEYVPDGDFYRRLNNNNCYNFINEFKIKDSDLLTNFIVL